MKYKVGDKVLIKTWGEMVDEFDLDEDNNIMFPSTFSYWSRRDDRFLPENRIITIAKIEENDIYSFDGHFVYGSMIKKGTELKLKLSANIDILMPNKTATLTIYNMINDKKHIISQRKYKLCDVPEKIIEKKKEENMKYNVGDRVLIYTWDEMVSIFGTTSTHNININEDGRYWSKEHDINIPVNRIITITEIDDDGDYIFVKDGINFYIYHEMVKAIVKNVTEGIIGEKESIKKIYVYVVGENQPLEFTDKKFTIDSDSKYKITKIWDSKHELILHLPTCELRYIKQVEV